MWRSDRAEAHREYSPFYLYFVHTLWHHGSLEKASSPKGTGYLSSSSYDYIKPENRVGAGVDREGMQTTTLADIERKIDNGELAWGSPKDVADQLIAGAERMGANHLLLNMNVGAMAHDVFLEQIRRFGRDVLPRLQAHQVKRVPAAPKTAMACVRPASVVPQAWICQASSPGISLEIPPPPRRQ